MARSDAVDLSWRDVFLAAVVMLDMEAARNAVADVLNLAAIGVRHRFDAFRPAPTGLERVTADLPAS